MFWNEDTDQNTEHDQHSTIDVVFRMQGNTLPTDFQSQLAQALARAFAWWSENNSVSFYLMLAGEEGNGWFRESNAQAVLYLSRRCKLVIRTPLSMLETVLNMNGGKFTLGQHSIRLEHKSNRQIKHSATLYSRYVVSDQEEIQFLETVQQQLANMNIQCKKMLCGKTRKLKNENEEVSTRSLMLNELSREDSLRLQTLGLGDFQKLGCGVFLPYKSITKPG